MSLNDILSTSSSGSAPSISIDSKVCKDEAKPECQPPESSGGISTQDGEKVNITIKSCKSISKIGRAHV